VLTEHHTQFSTAVSTHVALTLWYQSVQPNESMVEWWFDENSSVTHAVRILSCQLTTKHSHGLPTQSSIVSEFMIELEKTKAKAGEVSQSAHALLLEDIHHLYNICFNPKLTDAQKQWGAI
jgi:hypothetical protein